MHTLMTHFKLSLARIEQMGYRKCVEFGTSVVEVRHASREQGKPAPASPQHEFHGKSSEKRAARMQIMRANRNPDQHRVHWREDWELTAEQRARRISGRKWQATHRAKQAALALEKES